MKLFLFAFLLGAFSTLAMAPYNIWITLFIGLSGLFLIVHKEKKPLKATWICYFYFFGYFLFGLSWIANALLVKDNPYWWAWPLGLVVLQAVLAYAIWLSAYAYKYLSVKYNKKQKLFIEYMLFCWAIIFSEWLRSWAFTGLPWNMFGYTWVDTLPIAQLAGIANIYLLGAITVFWAVAPAYIILSKKRAIPALLLVASFALSYAFGVHKINQYEQSEATTFDNYSFTIAQPNIPQTDKINYKKTPDNFLKHIEQSRYDASEHNKTYKAYYIIWPESAVPLSYAQKPFSLSLIRSVLQGYPAPAYLIIGASRYEKSTDEYFNSIVTIDKDANIIDTYDKRHLVPFGEYMPYSDIINILPFVGFKGFTKGTNGDVRESPEGMRFLPLICYEIIFPKYARAARAQNAEVIINVTNDAWYGKSAGPYQHLAQARFRAIESHTSILRSANTGISAIINPVGKIEYQSDLFVADKIITSK